MEDKSVTSFLYSGVRGYWMRRVGGGVVGWHLCCVSRWVWSGYLLVVEWVDLTGDEWWWRCERIGSVNHKGDLCEFFEPGG